MNGIIGIVENCTSVSVTGFVCIPKHSAPPELTVVVNSKLSGTASYGKNRELPLAVQTYYCREFKYAFANPIIGKSVISVKYANNTDLKNSPYLYCSDSLSNFYRNTSEIKAALSQTFISGSGIEIGALDNPFPVVDTVRVTYIDRMKADELREQYPELADKNIVNVDIVDDGESLASLENDSQNFIIASHFFEHAKNPADSTCKCNTLKVE